MCKELNPDFTPARIKVSYIKIFVTEWKNNPDHKPYYQIEYHDLSDDEIHCGFGSYKLEYVQRWAVECFDIVSAPPKVESAVQGE